MRSISSSSSFSHLHALQLHYVCEVAQHSTRTVERPGRQRRTKGRSRMHGMDTANSTCPKDGPASCTPHLLERGEPKGECEAKRGEEEMSKRFARQPRPFVCLFCRCAHLERRSLIFPVAFLYSGTGVSNASIPSNTTKRRSSTIACTCQAKHWLNRAL